MAGSGWGPPPNLQRGLIYPSQHGLPMSPNGASSGAASSSSAAQVSLQPPPPAPRPTGLHSVTGFDAPALNPAGDGMDDDEDDEEDDYDEDEDEDGADEDDAEADALSKKRKRKSVTDAQDHAGAGGDSKHGAGPPTASGEAGDGDASLEAQPRDKKPKVSRGSKACTNCRRLKMRCVPSAREGGYPCTRCLNSGGQCVFEASQRGKRTSKGKKAEAMAASLKKMEETLNSVLRSIRDPAGSGGGNIDLSPSYSMSTDAPNLLGSGHPTRSVFEPLTSAMPRVTSAPGLASARSTAISGAAGAGASPGGQHINPASIAAAAAPFSSSRSSHGGSQPAALSPEQERAGMTRAGDASSNPGSSHEPHQLRAPPKASPRLHSLPDNTLNPLGLLAEASLHSTERAHRRAVALHRRGTSFASSSREALGEDGDESGVSPAAGSERSAPGDGNASTPGAGRGSGGAKHGKQGSETAGKSTRADGKPGEGSALGANDGEQGDEDDNAPRFVPSENDYSRALGVASSSYFKPGPLSNLPLRRVIIEREIPPKLLTQGIISSEEILELFRIFFHYCATHIVLLDPDFHTPALICARSPFLFSAVCCVASRYYSHKRPDLYSKCLAEAKRCAFDIMSRGYKSVEIVQGFLLLSIWNQPSERYETDKTWLFSGVAMRMATDLNLHRKSVLTLPPDMSPNDPIVLEREREILNRERTWYICFTMDRALSAQMGKPYTIREDFLIRNSRFWCEQRASRPWDVALSALVELLRLTSRMLDMLYSSTSSVNGLNADLDYSTMLRIWNEQLEEARDQWSYKGVFSAAYRPQSDPFQDIKTRLAAQRAHIHLRTPPTTAQADNGAAENATTTGSGDPPASTSGVQRNIKKEKDSGKGDKKDGADDNDDEGMRHDQRILYFCVKQAPLRWHYAVLIINSFGLQRSLDAGSEDKGYFFMKCLGAAKGMLQAALDGLKPVLRYAPDNQFVMISYACVFLLKLLRKEFRGWIDDEEVLTLISTVINLLDEVAVNETHTPALHATFLRRLLNARSETRPGSPYMSGYPSRVQTPANAGGVVTTTLTDHASFETSARRDGAQVAPASSTNADAHGQHGVSGRGTNGVAASNTNGADPPVSGVQSTAPTAEHGLDGLAGLPSSSEPSLSSTFAFGNGAFGTGANASLGGSNLANNVRFAVYSPNVVASPARFPDDHGGMPFSFSGEASSHAAYSGFETVSGTNTAAAAAAAFGVSSLAQLFPSNMGFSGSGAPADSSHAAAMHLSSHQHHPQAGGANGLGAEAMGQLAGSNAGGGVGGAHAAHGGAGSSSASAAAGAHAPGVNQAATTHPVGGAAIGESVFDDNFWSTLLPPGFGASAPLGGLGMGAPWDFVSSSAPGSSSGAGAGAGTGTGAGGGMNVGLGMGFGAFAQGGHGASHGAGTGTGTAGGSASPWVTGGGVGLPPSTMAEGSTPSAGPKGARAPTATRATTSTSAGNSAAGAGAGAGSHRDSTPSAVGAFNF